MRPIDTAAQREIVDLDFYARQLSRLGDDGKAKGRMQGRPVPVPLHGHSRLAVELARLVAPPVVPGISLSGLGMYPIVGSVALDGARHVPVALHQ